MNRCCAGKGCCASSCGGGGCGASGLCLGSHQPAKHRLTMRTPARPQPHPMTGHFFSLDKSGLVGVAVNGVPIFYDHPGKDGARTLDLDFDECLGHTKGETYLYHYHFLPICLFRQLGIPSPSNLSFWQDQSGDFARYFPAAIGQVFAQAPPVIGWALDGAPILGPYGRDGKVVRRDQLDKCGGQVDPTSGVYAYYMTFEVPYLPSCLYGRPGNFTDQGLVEACRTLDCSPTPVTPYFLFPTNPPLDSPRWQAHSLSFGVLFLVLFVVVMILAAQEARIRRRYSLTAGRCLFFFVSILSFTRALFFLVDPYYTKKRFPPIIEAMLFTTTFPALVSCIAITLVIKMKLMASIKKMKSFKIYSKTQIGLAIWSVLQFLTQYVADAFRSAGNSHGILVICQAFFICWGITVAIGQLPMTFVSYTHESCTRVRAAYGRVCVSSA